MVINIFIRFIAFVFCLQLWTLDQAAAVEGTWTQYYEEPYSNLVRGGQEGTDTWPTFICQATLPQGVYPGKFAPGWSTCYIALAKSEVRTRDFKVLMKSKIRSYVWVDPNGSGNERKIRESGVEGGYTRQGKKLWICRTKSVTVYKGFWSGSATLIGNVEEGGEQCIAPWLEASKAYSDYEVLIDESPASANCVPTERFEIIHSVRNSGDLDQTITKEYRTGIERRRGSSFSIMNSETNSESQSASFGLEIKGIKAGFESSVGKSKTTGFDWTQTSGDVWTLSTTHTLPINVKAGTHGILKQLVGICGDVEVRTGRIDVDAKPL